MRRASCELHRALEQWMDECMDTPTTVCLAMYWWMRMDVLEYGKHELPSTQPRRPSYYC